MGVVTTFVLLHHSWVIFASWCIVFIGKWVLCFYCLNWLLFRQKRMYSRFGVFCCCCCWCCYCVYVHNHAHTLLFAWNNCTIAQIFTPIWPRQQCFMNLKTVSQKHRPDLTLVSLWIHRTSHACRHISYVLSLLLSKWAAVLFFQRAQRPEFQQVERFNWGWKFSRSMNWTRRRWMP